jgi:hypothetical protein
MAALEHLVALVVKEDLLIVQRTLNKRFSISDA